MGYLGDKIFDFLLEKGSLALEEKAIKKELNERIQAVLLKYESEVFYNNFIKYIEMSNKIEQIASNLYDKSPEDTIPKNRLATIILENFTSINQGISHGDYPQLKTLIESIIETIDSVLNRPRTAEERRIQNKVSESNSELSSKIIDNQNVFYGALQNVKALCIENNSKTSEVYEMMEKLKSSLALNLTQDNGKDLLLEPLTEESIKYSIEDTRTRKVTIDSSNGELTARITVKKNYLLSKFSSIEEIYAYVNKTMESITVEAISADFFINGKLYEHMYINSLYTGETLTLSFRTYGQVDVVEVNNFFETRRSKEVITSEFTISPVIPAPFLLVDIYDEELRCVINNVQFRAIRKLPLQDGHVKIIATNELQKEVPIVMILEMIIMGANIISCNIEINYRDISTVTKRLEWFEIRKRLTAGTITGKVHNTNKTIFGGVLVFDGISNEKMESEYDLISKLNYIEKRLQLNFNSLDFRPEDIDNIYNVYDILKTGKYVMGKVSGDIPLGKKDMESEIKKGHIIWLTFTNTSGIPILDQVIDIGPQRLIITKAEIEEFDDETMKVKSCDDSLNLRIAYKYYKHKYIDDILKEEGISDISPTELSFLDKP